MLEFNHAEELVNVFSKYIFDQASVDYKQQIVINALDKITKDKKRIIGFLRFQTIKEKLTQCISQSYEIKTGYILEDYFEKLFGFHFHELSKIVNGYKCDQLFEDDNYIYLIEQKIRDDHDTSKRGGQVEKFIQKIAALEEKCIQKNKKLKAYMWFVDDNFKKNKSFYAEKLSHIGNEYTEEVSLYYGRTIVDYILGNQEIWDNFVTSFIKLKHLLPLSIDEFFKIFNNRIGKDIISFDLIFDIFTEILSKYDIRQTSFKLINDKVRLANGKIILDLKIEDLDISLDKYIFNVLKNNNNLFKNYVPKEFYN